MSFTPKLILFSMLLHTSFTIHCSETSSTQISIRLATLHDIHQIDEISSKQYHNDFKPMWVECYVPLFKLTEDPEQAIQRIIHANAKNNREFIANQENKRLLVAELTRPEQPKKIAGFCRFEKKSDKVMYMNFILVDENVRKQGIAKQLAQTAMNTWPDVKECQFRAMVHNKKINDIYKKLGCIQKGTVSLHPDFPGKTFTESDAPATHFDYSYVIKK